MAMEDVYITMASPFIVFGPGSASIPSKLGSNIISEPLPPWPASTAENIRRSARTALIRV